MSFKINNLNQYFMWGLIVGKIGKLNMPSIDLNVSRHSYNKKSRGQSNALPFLLTPRSKGQATAFPGQKSFVRMIIGIHKSR